VNLTSPELEEENPNPHLRPTDPHPLKPPQILTPKKSLTKTPAESLSDPSPHHRLDPSADSCRKIGKAINGCNRLYLSEGDRLTLIKDTLSNLPTYYLSLFPIQIGVANGTEKLQRELLWGGINEEFKLNIVNRSKICFPKQTGGLGVRNLIRFNQALLGKWL